VSRDTGIGDEATDGGALKDVDTRGIGEELHSLVRELYPICRSITGDGVRETLRRIGERIPLEVREVPTGTEVLDWTVPREWNIREAWIRGPDGRTVVDFDDHNLHVMGYSSPVHRRMPLEELRPHLHTLPDHPDWIPYRTSYYTEDWGFCLRHQTLKGLESGEYEVLIDADLEPGHLTYAECVLPGRTDEEVLISAHCCHPSLANDNLSGLAVATGLARVLDQLDDRRFTYRFVFAPATIGAITWLDRNEGGAVAQIRHGLVLAGVGDPGSPNYKRTRAGDAQIDRAVEHVLWSRSRRNAAGEGDTDHDIQYEPGPDRGSGSEAEETPHVRGAAAGSESHRSPSIHRFTPYGYDERQYGSPGFALPVGCLMRTPHGTYPEYHTSADDPELVRPESLADTLELCLEVFDLLEENRRYRNLQPRGEPQLGRRGLYRDTGGERLPDFESALLWILAFSDGEHDLLAIAQRSGLGFDAVRQAADALVESDLIAPVEAVDDE